VDWAYVRSAGGCTGSMCSREAACAAGRVHVQQGGSMCSREAACAAGRVHAKVRPSWTRSHSRVGRIGHKGVAGGASHRMQLLCSHTHTRARAHIHTCTQTRTHTHAHIHAHKHAHTHTHTGKEGPNKEV